MKLLAVDTSCDESCVAIVDTESWKLCSEIVHTHIEVMAPYGGIVPEIASREHLRALPLSVDQACKKAGLRLSDLDWFAVSNEPGLIGALLVGLSYIKGLSFACGKPYSVFNHVEAHLYSPLLASFEGEKVPPFPWIALVVSGGHTELFLVENEQKYKWISGTQDDAAGEAFDKIGKLLGLPYPAGPRLDRWVKESATDSDRRAFEFPKAQLADFAFSFSGLKTAVATESTRQKTEDEKVRLQLAASAQEAIVEAIALQLDAAQKALGVDQIVITGGVACNSRLREKLPQAYFPKPRHCTDNAAMVALLAALREKGNCLAPAPFEVGAKPVAQFVVSG